MSKVHENNAKVFKALCDEKRLIILEMLRDGERCACRILEDIDIGQSSLSYHMKILVESGIVKGRQDGKWTHYSISSEGCMKAHDLLNEITTVSYSEMKNEHCEESCQ